MDTIYDACRTESLSIALGRLTHKFEDAKLAKRNLQGIRHLCLVAPESGLKSLEFNIAIKPRHLGILTIHSIPARACHSKSTSHSVAK